MDTEWCKAVGLVFTSFVVRVRLRSRKTKKKRKLARAHSEAQLYAEIVSFGWISMSLETYSDRMSLFCVAREILFRVIIEMKSHIRHRSRSSALWSEACRDFVRSKRLVNIQSSLHASDCEPPGRLAVQLNTAGYCSMQRKNLKTSSGLYHSRHRMTAAQQTPKKRNYKL